jgi:DNA repair protein RecO (recombination protein O)
MPVYKADAIVLRRRPLGEADRVLTLYTKEWGKVSAVARGVRKSTSRMAGSLEPFEHVRLLLARGRGSLDVVAQVEVIDALAPLWTDLWRFGTAALLAELVDAATPEREPHPEVFALLVEALALVAAGLSAPVAPWFILHLVALAGFQPALQRCAVCARDAERAPHWSHPLGGLVCSRCAGRDPAAVRLRAEAPRLLRALGAAAASTLSTLRIGAREHDSLRQLLHRYAEHRLEVQLRTAVVLGQLRVAERQGPQPGP